MSQGLREDAAQRGAFLSADWNLTLKGFEGCDFVACLVGFHHQPRGCISWSAICRVSPGGFLGPRRSYQLLSSSAWIWGLFLLH